MKKRKEKHLIVKNGKVITIEKSSEKPLKIPTSAEFS